MLSFTEESTPWSKMGIIASTLLPSCPIPEMGEEKSLPILQQVFSFCLLGENKSRFKSRNIVLHGGIHSLVQDGNHGLHPSPILPNSRDGWRKKFKSFQYLQLRAKITDLNQGNKFFLKWGEKYKIVPKVRSQLNHGISKLTSGPIVTSPPPKCNGGGCSGILHT